MDSVDHGRRQDAEIAIEKRLMELRGTRYLMGNQ